MAALSVCQPFVTNMEMELNEMQEDKALKNSVNGTLQLTSGHRSHRVNNQNSEKPVRDLLLYLVRHVVNLHSL